jgi:hypothetical protein
MTSALTALYAVLRTSLQSRIELQLEVLALRQQIHVLERSRRARVRLSRADRAFWLWLSHVWIGWRRALVIVQPATVLAWHRQGLRLFWMHGELLKLGSRSAKRLLPSIWSASDGHHRRPGAHS